MAKQRLLERFDKGHYQRQPVGAHACISVPADTKRWGTTGAAFLVLTGWCSPARRSSTLYCGVAAKIEIAPCPRGGANTLATGELRRAQRAAIADLMRFVCAPTLRAPSPARGARRWQRGSRLLRCATGAAERIMARAKYRSVSRQPPVMMTLWCAAALACTALRLSARGANYKVFLQDDCAGKTRDWRKFCRNARHPRGRLYARKEPRRRPASRLRIGAEIVNIFIVAN